MLLLNKRVKVFGENLVSQMLLNTNFKRTCIKLEHKTLNRSRINKRQIILKLDNELRHISFLESVIILYTNSKLLNTLIYVFFVIFIYCQVA